MNRETFLEVMTAFPTGVAIVTTLDASGKPFGFTSNAVSSVSADPPTLLVCVAKTSRTLPALRRSGGFLVNFMGEGSADICMVFASRAEPDDKFSTVEWRPSTKRRPHLDTHSIAYAECETEHEVEASSHIIFIGRVTEGAVTDSARRPIAYLNRSFCEWPTL